MVIEINKDIENYKETVCLGLTAKQLIFSIVSLGAGAGIILGLYQKIGIMASCYIATPIIAPIALCGFYSFNGMDFPTLARHFIASVLHGGKLLWRSSESPEEVWKAEAEIKAAETKEEARKAEETKKAEKEAKKGRRKKAGRKEEG